MTLEEIEQIVFEYKLNGETKYADPWRVFSHLYLSNDIAEVYGRFQSQSLEMPERIKAQEEFLSLVRDAFGLKPVEEAGPNGVASDKVVELFETFIDFLEDVKKKQPGWLNRLVPTDYSGLIKRLQSELDSSSQSSESESSTTNPTST